MECTGGRAWSFESDLCGRGHHWTDPGSADRMGRPRNLLYRIAIFIPGHHAKPGIALHLGVLSDRHLVCVDPMAAIARRSRLKCAGTNIEPHDRGRLYPGRSSTDQLSHESPKT